jgi:hypothetical protein
MSGSRGELTLDARNHLSREVKGRKSARIKWVRDSYGASEGAQERGD